MTRSAGRSGDGLTAGEWAHFYTKLLTKFTGELRQLRADAGQPSLAALGREIRRGDTQIGDILNARIKQVPPWEFVEAFIKACEKRVTDRRQLSVSADVDYWRFEHALLERLAEYARVGRQKAGTDESGQDRRGFTKRIFGTESPIRDTPLHRCRRRHGG